MSTLTLTGAGPTSGAAQIGPISTVPEWWFKADAITGKVDGDALATWADSSGNGRDATQATGARQPIYKTNVLNSKPVVRFLIASQQWIATAAISAKTQPNTMFAVAKVDAGNSYVFDGVTSGNRHAFGSFGTSNALAIFAGTTVRDTPQLAPQAAAYYSLLFNGASSQVWKNGSSVLSGVSPGTNSLTGLTIGSHNSQAAFSSGDIAEIIVYAGALSAGDRQTVEAYLATKYAL